VSPGLTPKLAEAGKTCVVPFIPGINTASEIMRAREWHFKQLKFFPAEASGGAKTLRDFKSVFQDVTFCPTGGIHLENMHQYLELDNVFAVGGSWLVTSALIENNQWDDITQMAELTVKKSKNYHSVAN
jgi:2-dehydro-3-deoxyphosphogluconate aldolase/(4S)-4-hydroxy-2-oxoglutarate aldolase